MSTYKYNKAGLDPKQYDIYHNTTITIPLEEYDMLKAASIMVHEDEFAKNKYAFDPLNTGIATSTILVLIGIIGLLVLGIINFSNKKNAEGAGFIGGSVGLLLLSPVLIILITGLILKLTPPNRAAAIKYRRRYDSTINDIRANRATTGHFK